MHGKSQDIHCTSMESLSFDMRLDHIGSDLEMESTVGDIG
jgi:hypothetical protein